VDRLEHLHRLKNDLFALFAESLKRPQLSSFASLFHVRNRAALNLLRETPPFFGSERLQTAANPDRCRIFFKSFCRQSVVAVFTILRGAPHPGSRSPDNSFNFSGVHELLDARSIPAGIASAPPPYHNSWLASDDAQSISRQLCGLPAKSGQYVLLSCADYKRESFSVFRGTAGVGRLFFIPSAADGPEAGQFLRWPQPAGCPP